MSLRFAGVWSHSNRLACKATRSQIPSLSSPQTSRNISKWSHALLPQNAERPSIAFGGKNLLSKPTRRALQSERFQQFVPPSPESLGKAAPAKQYRRSIKWGRRLLIISGVTGILYLIDSQFYASSISRSLRTFGLGIVVATDYKLNFRESPLFGGDIVDLHRRSAERLFNLLHQNGGLYLKIGQAIAMQSAVLPPEFQKMFSRMFDDAPQNEWADVEKVIREEFGGRTPEEVFGVSFSNEPGKGVMEKKARASASVAQVHWARLADGREVAIKVQKREIDQQVGWDLWSFKVVMKVYTWWFDLPFYSLVPYITERLQLETDFVNEADNSEKMAELVAGEPRLRGRVYIPKVYRELSSKRIMTAEWIEGVRLWDKETLTGPWLGGNGKGSPGAKNTPLSVPTSTRANDGTGFLKPDRNEWRGRKGKGGLGLPLKEVMTTMIDLFSAQMFLWGLVHCDPHPGNIFIRRMPNGHAELVLIDHGLYVSMSPKFRHQYCQFWKAIMTFDNETLSEITSAWGVKAPDLFASATLMRPYEGGDGSTRGRVTGKLEGKTAAERHFEVQQRMRQGIREILSEEENFPRELLFIGRNMRIVQGNNQFLGSPVNRIKMTGYWASRSLVDSKDLSFSERLVNAWRHMLFRFVLFSTDVVFYGSKVRQWFGFGGGMEDDLERQMRFIAKDQFGVELQHSVFEG
ncbi:ABC transporter [Mollisia scopiformis]|uniref:ABC transporter n=1 Tax=Mollisia scopiformis TaxID=149040 RepID=A0A194X2W6_MOLSC|nr:ABC transporter [Mollisia scopiformis]KUJ14369.1 ABC transporter [Mollisia scopiformis]